MRSFVEEKYIMASSMVMVLIMISFIGSADLAPVNIFTFFMTLNIGLYMTFLHVGSLALLSGGLHALLSRNLGALRPRLLSRNSDTVCLWNQFTLFLEDHPAFFNWIFDANFLWFFVINWEANLKKTKMYRD